MTKFNAYICYLDDGKNAYRIVVPATSEKDARQYVAGNGDIIAVKKCDDLKININYLRHDLAPKMWGKDEIDLITRTLQRVGIGE